tara:strand:+ start:14739 stop:15134 length:396 start_codon:yes stop_codon:yes gene_type:complete
MLFTLPQIEGKIREFTGIMYAPDEFIPTFGYTTQTGLPHIDIEKGHYLLIVCERGVELSRERFKDPDALLFKVLHDISFSMAFDSIAEDANYQNYKTRLLQTQKNIISKVNGYFVATEKQSQHDSLTTELV